MGQSGKPNIAYQFADHARYLDAWFDALGLADCVLIGHDWAAPSLSTGQRATPNLVMRSTQSSPTSGACKTDIEARG